MFWSRFLAGLSACFAKVRAVRSKTTIFGQQCRQRPSDSSTKAPDNMHPTSSKVRHHLRAQVEIL